MEPSDVERSVEAAMAVATSLGLAANRATVLQNSNKVTLRLLPDDVLARVAPAEQEHARGEVDLARQLTAAGCSVASLDPRVAPQGYLRDGLEITFWTFHESVEQALSPASYARALERLHAGMRSIAWPVPHMAGRVAQAEEIVSDPSRSPDLAADDRALLVHTLRDGQRAIQSRNASEQILHGEPHPGNVLNTRAGPVFIDLETCCRGPVEFDLAHTPVGVPRHYPGVDPAMLADCRRLVLAMVGVWRWEIGDQLPRGAAFGRAILDALRSGPPWPAVNELSPVG